MTIPSVFFGKYADVKKNVGKLITKMRKGNSITDSLNALEYTRLVPGGFEIILDGPSPLNGARSAFHMFALPRLLLERSGSTRETIAAHNDKLPTYFEELNESFWGHLCVSCRQHVYNYFASETIRVKYIKSILDNKSTYDQFQDRFDANKHIWLQVHSRTKSILDHPDHVAKFVLAHLRIVEEQIEGEELRVALSNSSFEEFVNMFRIEEYVRNCI